MKNAERELIEAHDLLDAVGVQRFTDDGQRLLSLRMRISSALEEIRERAKKAAAK